MTSAHRATHAIRPNADRRRRNAATATPITAIVSQISLVPTSNSQSGTTVDSAGAVYQVAGSLSTCFLSVGKPTHVMNRRNPRMLQLARGACFLDEPPVARVTDGVLQRYLDR